MAEQFFSEPWKLPNDAPQHRSRFSISASTTPRTARADWSREGLDLLDEMAPMPICGVMRELGALRPSRGGAKRRASEVTEVSPSTVEHQVPCARGSGRPYHRCCGAH